ncbi:uncharacterized protein N7459_010098 [Penicillium hispanicum]|uniref:uncharacterized protein n=1 Tax=Penicillium hispanicum TaxID=1080232 RepID=UPI00253FE5EF|nr:uncharacterized protein N7459_010098 [Penicillium hispanicum]KAJ5566716.1 hypothetical protein N7459_010098 [Penicillium hispanicum]
MSRMVVSPELPQVGQRKKEGRLSLNECSTSETLNWMPKKTRPVKNLFGGECDRGKHYGPRRLHLKCPIAFVEKGGTLPSHWTSPTMFVKIDVRERGKYWRANSLKRDGQRQEAPP